MLKTNASVAIVDDHILLRNGLANRIRSRETYAILFEAGTGKDIIKQVQPRYLSNVVLDEVNMPNMDGHETALWLKRNHPGIKILALSGYDDENAVVRMMKNGVRGYILQQIESKVFRRALDSLMRKGVHYHELIAGRLLSSGNQDDKPTEPNKCPVLLNAREIEFLKLVCTEMTYKEIAEKMYLSARTIDGYRDALFEKLSAKSRVGLVLFAIKNNIVDPGLI